MVNNVETLAAVPWIVRHGGEAYARRGTPAETGTKLVCLSERFARPGCYEVELGTPVRRIVTELGGGLKDGAELAALQVGGPLGGFLSADALDVPLSEAGLSARGAALGHAGLVSGKTVLAVIVWLLAWGVLYAVLHNKPFETVRALVISLVLIALGVLGTFPPFFQLFA
ncbi:SLBB domain-containing protein [Streptomyces sp. NPDC048825]|uniref:SLBB domain-containing protein n=1 Tax=Streptomyces sp. NPDC048825 TaxID=3365592 RepID=UPI0037246692